MSSRPATAAPSAAARQAEALTGAGFADVNGAVHRLSELNRPLVLVNLWAAWCARCRTELPTIRWLAERLGPNAIDVVLLSHEMNWAGDVTYARAAGIDLSHWRLSMDTSAAVVAAVFHIESDRFRIAAVGCPCRP